MRDSIEETKQMLESHYYFTDPKVMFYEIKDEMVQIVRDNLSLPKDEAYKFVCTWLDNRH